MEGELANQELRALLVLADLTKGDRSRAVAVGSFEATSRGGNLAVPKQNRVSEQQKKEYYLRTNAPRGLGGELFPRGLASCRLACGLLGTSHRFACLLTVLLTVSLDRRMDASYHLGERHLTGGPVLPDTFLLASYCS